AKKRLHRTRRSGIVTRESFVMFVSHKELRMRAAKSKKSVGVIGLGIMGSAYAKCLMDAGWHVVGFDTNPTRRKEAAKAGVEVVKNAEAAARAVPIIITSLPTPAALHMTVEGIIKAGAPGRVLIEAGTFALEDKLKAAERMHAAGHIALDCPVSGTGSQAQKKDIVIYASGDTKTIGKLRLLFAGFSRATYDLGVYGNGSRMKYVANLLVAIHNVASAEAMVLGMKAGLNPKIIYQLVTAGARPPPAVAPRRPLLRHN